MRIAFERSDDPFEVLNLTFVNCTFVKLVEVRLSVVKVVESRCNPVKFTPVRSELLNVVGAARMILLRSTPERLELGKARVVPKVAPAKFAPR